MKDEIITLISADQASFRVLIAYQLKRVPCYSHRHFLKIFVYYAIVFEVNGGEDPRHLIG